MAPATERTKRLMHKLQNLMSLEQEFGGVLDIDTQTVTSLLNLQTRIPGQNEEIIVGLSKPIAPLKRGVNHFGGLKMTRNACKAYGYELSQKVEDEFLYRTTHNDGVFRVYNEETKSRPSLRPDHQASDAYGQAGSSATTAGRLYGIDKLIQEKRRTNTIWGWRIWMWSTSASWRTLSADQFPGKAQGDGGHVRLDISGPATTAEEAVQWLYFGYLGAIKEQNGAAMSLGRTSTFLDIYFERDLKWVLDESGAQEIMDDFVMKLRMARHLRTPEYNGNSCRGSHVDHRKPRRHGRGRPAPGDQKFLPGAPHLYNPLAPPPRPNLTVLWSKDLPAPSSATAPRSP